jgi:catechol 2,3-dioxygenase-like lactoylglutathione lyase family enzyme
MEKPISGIRHVTAIASNPQRNLDFYTEVLGASPGETYDQFRRSGNVPPHSEQSLNKPHLRPART